MARLLLIVLLLVGTPLAAGEMYRWVDDDGTVHFSDRRPTTGAEPLELEALNVVTPVRSAGAGEGAVDAATPAAAGGPITMYSTSWCGYCRQAREYFTAEGIPFREHDIEQSSRARRAYDRLGAGGVPLIKVGERRMNGFSVGRFERFYRP